MLACIWNTFFGAVASAIGVSAVVAAAADAYLRRNRCAQALHIGDVSCGPLKVSKCLDIQVSSWPEETMKSQWECQ